MRLNLWDRFLLAISPAWALERVRARAAVETFRSFDAAEGGHRTSGWRRSRGDVNSVTRSAGPELRTHARDLLRNNPYAVNAQDIVANNTVGRGIVPRPLGASAKEAAALWKSWADSTLCDSEGLCSFTGLLTLAMRAVFSDGEVLFRRRYRRPEDKLPVPMQVQLLEADFIDSTKDGKGLAGGEIIQGVEFDGIGRRVAYWLFDVHPGADRMSNIGVSKRVPAREILHVFLPKRTGQVRGLSWLASAIITLKDLDDYEDAELMKQKIAACFAAFITDTDGLAAPVGTVAASKPTIEQFEPGLITQLPPGKGVSFATPPQVTNGDHATRSLRKVAAGLSLSYEDFTGDYSHANFSSARLARIKHQAALEGWQWNMLIPQACAPLYGWFVEAAILSGKLKAAEGADWSVSPLPMIEPDKEALAVIRRVRGGLLTPSGAIREQGSDPEAFFTEYAADMAMLKEKKIVLDSDVSAVSQAGLTQQRVGAGAAGDGGSADNNPPAAKQALEIDFDIDEASEEEIRALLVAEQVFKETAQ